MSRNKTTMLLALALLATFTLGCGLLDSLTQKATDKGAEIANQGRATLEAVATQVVPTQPASGGASQGSAAPTVAPTQAVLATAAPAVGDAIDLSALSAMEDLGSFRMTAAITWTQVMTDGTTEAGTLEMLTERDSASQASRFRMSGAWPDVAGGVTSTDSGAMEMIQIGNSMYMSTGDGEWVSMQMSLEDMQGQFGWDSDPRDFAHGSGTYRATETVNGYRGAKRYHYSESGIGSLGFGQVDTSESDVWVAEVGEGADKVTVIVKVVTTWSGTDVEGTEWSGSMRVDVTDVNDPIVIEPPEGVEPPGMPEDVPVMEGAANVQSMMGISTFTIEATTGEVIEFYDEEMAANGWEIEDSGIPTMRTYAKGNREAMLIVEEDDGGSEVTIMITEQ